MLPIRNRPEETTYYTDKGSVSGLAGFSTATNCGLSISKNTTQTIDIQRDLIGVYRAVSEYYSL